MIVRLLSILGSTASLIGLALMFHPTGQGVSILESILLGTGIALAVVAVASDFRDYRAKRPKVLKTSSKSEITCSAGSKTEARFASFE